MRCFISVNLPSEIKKHLGDVISQLDRQNRRLKIKWVEPENIHLTLAFLGELTEQQIEMLSRGLSTIKFKTFQVELDGLGAFPNIFRPQVIKIALRDSGQNLKKISNAIRQILSTLKIAADNKPFSSHITLGRVRDRVVRINLKVAVEPLSFQIANFDLMKSQLNPTGPVYSRISSFI